ncbi:MAG: MBL fold metallo-hydrolase [Chloroflexi bacterium]|nr:MBL fold metallo-hydrolase [Chloroflexota bacterium]
MAPLTYKVGPVRVHLLDDGEFRADGGAMFGVAPRILWEGIFRPDALHRIPLALRSLLIESSEGLILVDTGHGHKLTTRQRELLGLTDDCRVDGRLAEIGLRPADVRYVVNTHLHADHAGGNTAHSPDGQLVAAFPNATYLMQRLELADATYPNERTRNAYFRENFLPLGSLCRGDGASAMQVLNGDAQISSEVRVQITPGHTRGHQVVIVESGGETAIFLGDAAACAINLERLAWVPAYDVEPLVSMETKRSLRDWAFRRDALLFFQHDVAIPAGRIHPDGDGWRVETVETP